MHPFEGDRTLTRFLSASEFATLTLAHMSDSLVRVSRRVGSVRKPSRILASAAPRKGAGHGAYERSSTRGPRDSALNARRRIRSLFRGPRRSCLRTRGEPLSGQDGLIRLLPTISRTISHFLQSSFHLSLTVLVRYRSPANI